MSKRDELTIEMELQRLYKQSESLGLTPEDVVKLEKLIKLRALMNGQATSISKSIKADQLSDDDLLAKLSETE